MSTQKKTKLRVAVAGTGFGVNHLQGYADSDLCEIVAVWSRTENERSKKAASTYNIPLYIDGSVKSFQLLTEQFPLF